MLLLRQPRVVIYSSRTNAAQQLLTRPCWRLQANFSGPHDGAGGMSGGPGGGFGGGPGGLGGRKLLRKHHGKGKVCAQPAQSRPLISCM